MSSLVLKMTTAASHHPILHTTTKTKKPYYYYYNSSSSSSPNLNWLSSITRRPHHHRHNKYYGWWRITPCAPLAHKATTTTNSILFRHRNLGPRFRGLHKCLCVSSASSSSSRSGGRSSSSENQGDISGGRLMADMGSENHKHDLLSPIENHHHQPQSPKLLTLPTILTLGRVAAVPLLISTFYVDSWWGKTATTSIFIAAAITDWLDGHLARRMRLGSAFGAFLDPVADKLMVAATLVLLCSRPNDVTVFGQVPWLLVVPSIAIIGREITMSAVREWAASQNTKLLEAVAVNNLGKWKTATQMIALTILLATRDSSLGGPEFVVASGVVLLYISAGLAVWSLVVYMSKIWKVLLR